jgi:dTDP-4-dehydrorhamnose reductase
MIALVGASGYIGKAFARELNHRCWEWEPVPHEQCLQFIDATPRLRLVINCAAFIPKESVSQCDAFPEHTIQGNLVLPILLTNACRTNRVTLAHISTGCLWSDGESHDEMDLPQRAFKGHCGFYIGTKFMAEREVQRYRSHYIWRVRLPFDEFDNERNYLTKLARFTEVWDHNNSVSHRADFVKACLDLHQNKAEFGTYNVMNTGSLKASDIARELLRLGIRKTEPIIIPNNEGSSMVSNLKLLRSGVSIRPAAEALRESLEQWKEEYV